MPILMRKEKGILRYPRLDTVLMVEEFIQEHGGEYGKKQIWERLPRKVMYQTFCVIFDYLTYSYKIGIDKEGKVCWIWNPEGVKRYSGRKDLSWR